MQGPDGRHFVCLVPNPKSRMEGQSKLKIGRNDAHDTGDLWPYLVVERSKVKVSRPINAEKENAPYLPKGDRKLQTWYMSWSTMTRIIDMRGDVKGRCNKVMSSVWRMFAHNTTDNEMSQKHIRISRNIVHATGDIAHQFQSQQIKGQGHQTDKCRYRKSATS